MEALLVACLTPDIAQILSRREKPAIPLPWPGLLADLQERLATTVVSYKVGRRLFGKRRNPATGQVEITPRGELHGETRFGTIRPPEGSPHAAATVVLRYPLDASFGKVSSIVDPAIRNRVADHLARYDDDPKGAFGHLTEHPVFTDDTGAVPIRSVRCRSFIQHVFPLPGQPGQAPRHVRASGNHHAAIYRHPDGTLFFKVVSVWEAFQRKLRGESVVLTSLLDGSGLLYTLQPNDLVVVGRAPHEVDRCLQQGTIQALSPYLYRVQKLHSHVLHLRHHASATLSEDSLETRVRALRLITSLDDTVLIKVRANRLGELMHNDWGLENAP